MPQSCIVSAHTDTHCDVTASEVAMLEPGGPRREEGLHNKTWLREDGGTRCRDEAEGTVTQQQLVPT